VCVLLFYGAAWYVRDGATAARVFGGLALAAVLVCIFALQQWLGGLEETRRFAAGHINPATSPADLLLRLSAPVASRFTLKVSTTLPVFLIAIWAASVAPG